MKIHTSDSITVHRVGVVLTHGDDSCVRATDVRTDVDAYGPTMDEAFARLDEISAIDAAHRTAEATP